MPDVAASDSSGAREAMGLDDRPSASHRPTPPDQGGHPGERGRDRRDAADHGGGHDVLACPAELSAGSRGGGQVSAARRRRSAPCPCAIGSPSRARRTVMPSTTAKSRAPPQERPSSHAGSRAPHSPGGARCPENRRCPAVPIHAMGPCAGDARLPTPVRGAAWMPPRCRRQLPYIVNAGERPRGRRSVPAQPGARGVGRHCALVSWRPADATPVTPAREGRIASSSGAKGRRRIDGEASTRDPSAAADGTEQRHAQRCGRPLHRLRGRTWRAASSTGTCDGRVNLRVARWTRSTAAR